MTAIIVFIIARYGYIHFQDFDKKQYDRALYALFLFLLPNNRIIPFSLSVCFNISSNYVS